MSIICIGNPNFVSLVELHSKGLAAFVNNFAVVTDTNYREANVQTVKSCTSHAFIHSDGNVRCAGCSKYMYMYHSTLHALHNRLKSVHQKSIDTYSHINFWYLNTQEKVDKLLCQSQFQNKRLKRMEEKMETGTSINRIVLEDELQ